jgi:hypothetical protein
MPFRLARYATLETAVAVRAMPEYQIAPIALPASKASFHRRYREYASFRQEVWREVKTVVSVESPVHITEVMRRLWQAAGYKVFTASEETTDQIIRDVLVNDGLRRRGDFLWRATMSQPPVRSRAQLPKVSRKFELIAPEEVEEAVLLVIDDAVVIAREEVALAVGRLFGFRQPGEGAVAAVHDAMERLVKQGRVTAVGEQLSTLVDLLQQNS